MKQAADPLLLNFSPGHGLVVWLVRRWVTDYCSLLVWLKNDNTMRRITSDRNECRAVLADYACDEVLQFRAGALSNNHLPAFQFHLGIQKPLENFEAWSRRMRRGNIHRQQIRLRPIRVFGDSDVT